MYRIAGCAAAPSRGGGRGIKRRQRVRHTPRNVRVHRIVRLTQFIKSYFARGALRPMRSSGIRSNQGASRRNISLSCTLNPV